MHFAPASTLAGIPSGALWILVEYLWWHGSDTTNVHLRGSEGCTNAGEGTGTAPRIQPRCLRSFFINKLFTPQGYGLGSYTTTRPCQAYAGCRVWAGLRKRRLLYINNTYLRPTIHG